MGGNGVEWSLFEYMFASIYILESGKPHGGFPEPHHPTDSWGVETWWQRKSMNMMFSTWYQGQVFNILDFWRGTGIEFTMGCWVTMAWLGWGDLQCQCPRLCQAAFGAVFDAFGENSPSPDVDRFSLATPNHRTWSIYIDVCTHIYIYNIQYIYIKLYIYVLEISHNFAILPCPI